MAQTSGGSVIWNLDVDDSKLSQGLSNAKKEAAAAADQIDKSLGSVTTSTKSAGQAFKEFADSAVAGSALIVGSLGLVANSAIQLGADYQSARVSFETFLQSGEKAGKLLSDLGEFATKTPFDLPQVVDGTKRLLAYGIAADDIIPTFRMLGDLSSGNKVKLDQLTLAYGQVRAATKLTGAELRQFTEAGIPLLDALATELNKNGGTLVAVGGAAKKTKVDVGEMNDKLAIAKKRLEEATKSGKTKESTMMSLRNTIQNYEQKLGSVNATTGETVQQFKRVKVSAADVKDMISDGAISFDQVSAALSKLTGEGGMFFKNMENQSKTFGGVMSNVGDEIKRFTLETLGFFIAGEQAGTVREGSIFFFLQQGAEGLLAVLQQIRPVATAFVDEFLKNQGAMAAALGALLGLLTPLAIAFTAMIAPALIFAAAGAAIGFVVFKLVEHFGGLEAIFLRIKPFIDAIAYGFQWLIAPAVAELSNLIANKLIPPIQQFWSVHGPTMSKILEAVAYMLTFVVLVAIRGVIEGIILFVETAIWWGEKISQAIKFIVSEFQWLYNILVGHSIIPDLINEIAAWFAKLPGMIAAGLSGVKDAIVKPFQDAWGEIQKIADKIKEQMDKISPFHRNSPSLVDKVNSGVDLIKNKYASLQSLAFPKVSETMDGMSPGFFSAGFEQPGTTNNSTNSNQNITVNVGTVQSKSDIDMISREIGFKAALLPAL